MVLLHKTQHFTPKVENIGRSGIRKKEKDESSKKYIFSLGEKVSDAISSKVTHD